jgi:hypothetical protein
MSELLQYQTFSDKEHASLTASILEKNGIMVEIIENPPLLDSNFIGQQFKNPFSLKIPAESFLTANKILLDQTEVNINEVDKDYILFSLTNEELEDVLKNKDDWGIYNYKLALQILVQRNDSSIETEEAKTRKLELNPDAQPKDANMFWVIVCYACIVLSVLSFLRRSSFFLFLFPQLSYIIFGYTLRFSKTTLSNGSRILTYTKNVRVHGGIILGAGIIFLLLLFAIVFKLLDYWGQ